MVYCSSGKKDIANISWWLKVRGPRVFDRIQANVKIVEFMSYVLVKRDGFIGLLMR